jgi:hypothetical protein
VTIVEKAVSRGLLQQILHLNRGTGYGQHYRFARIATPKSYKQAEDAVYKAVSEVMLQFGANLVDLTAMMDYEVFPCRYTLYVEIGYPDQDGMECSETPLEDALCHISPLYHSIRQIDRLGQLALRVVRPGTFEKLKKALIARGASACQVKIPRVIRDRELAPLLTANTLHTASDTLLAVW